MRLPRVIWPLPEPSGSPADESEAGQGCPPTAYAFDLEHILHRKAQREARASEPSRYLRVRKMRPTSRRAKSGGDLRCAWHSCSRPDVTDRDRGGDDRGPDRDSEVIAGRQPSGRHPRLKVSPAPVVSRTVAGGAGKCSACPSAFTISAPCPPRVTTTGARLTPASLRARSVMACRSSGESCCPGCASGCVWSSAATSALSSVALGVRIDPLRRTRRTAGTAGAGFKMHRTPAVVAASTAATIDSSGISVLTSTQLVRSRISDRASDTCRTVTAEFAPAPTAI